MPLTENNADNSSGLEDLFHRLRPELHRFVMRKISNAQDADDVIQQVYLEIANLDDVGRYEIRDMRSYLFGIANNMALTHIRKQARHDSRFMSDTGIEDNRQSGSAPDEIIASKQRLARLQQTIERMPAKRRQIFMLYRFSGMNIAAIATELDMSHAAVEKNVVRALAYLRDAFSGEEV